MKRIWCRMFHSHRSISTPINDHYTCLRCQTVWRVLWLAVILTVPLAAQTPWLLAYGFPPEGPAHSQQALYMLSVAPQLILEDMQQQQLDVSQVKADAHITVVFDPSVPPYGVWRFTIAGMVDVPQSAPLGSDVAEGMRNRVQSVLKAGVSQ